jgi:predicted metal-binding membrane protein
MSDASPQTRQRVLIVGVILFIIIASWAWIVPMAIDMYGAMDGPAAWMMTRTWDAPHLVALWAMWAVMMAGMMLPSALPLVLLYRRVQSGASAGVSPAFEVAAGYLLVWSIFSVGATILQRVLSAFLLLTPMMEMPRGRAAGVVLVLAGVYQLTPLKTACLAVCRSPLSFVMQRARRGPRAAFRLGVEHGWYCLGCCWALMLLLFVGGVMNLAVILAITAIVLAEKFLPFGVYGSRALGVLLIAAGAWLLI